MLVKYEVRVEGALRGDDEDHDTWRRTTVEVKAVGTTQLDLPRGATEAYFHDKWFYVFVNWDKCCRGVNSTYNMRVLT